jgi:hypothetical protein
MESTAQKRQAPREGFFEFFTLMEMSSARPVQARGERASSCMFFVACR